MDHRMSVLMTYIILFSSDSVQLENKKIIEKIQVKIAIFGKSFSYFFLLHGVPKKMSHFAWVKHYKVGHFLKDTVYVMFYLLFESKIS